MAHPKFSGLTEQVAQRRLAHLQKFHHEEAGEASAPAAKQLDIFAEAADVEIYHQYDPKTREVEWSYYTPDGRFLLQFGFSLVSRGYQIYSVHPGIFQDSEEMARFRQAIDRNLRGHYPPLELAWDSGKGPQVRRCAKA
jgi:hypothetical protein